MTDRSMRECPTDGVLALFVEGKLDAASRTAVLAHIESCSECMSAVLSANAHRAEEQVDVPLRFPSKLWIPLAAAAMIAIVAVPLLRRDRSPVAQLVALAPHSARHVEPRLTGGFSWAAYAGTARATETKRDAEQLKLAGAAGEVIERADRDNTADAQHVAGEALLLVDEATDAIPRLEAAAAKSNDAKTWSDLAAARYTAAAQLGRASLYPAALAAADNALRIDPKLAEGLFNRALILQRLGLTEEAKRAWKQYLDVDPSSDWATEARARLAAIQASTRSSQFERDRPLLERAAERNDAAGVRDYVTRYRDRARAFAEAEYLGRWGDALQRHDATEAARSLTMARSIGDALSAISGEALPRDAVRAIDRASDADRLSIAAAQVLYRRARIAYSRDARENVDVDLLHAAEQFDAAHDPMALMARYYAASVRLARNDTSAARADLERARISADAHPDYISLGGHVRWELGRACMLEYDWPAAALVLEEGGAMFRRSGERGSEAFVETLRARALTSLGRRDDAWLAWMRAFATLSAEGESVAPQLAASVSSAMHDELLAGHRDAALSLSALEVAIARGAARPQFVVDALANRALLESAASDFASALNAAHEADAIAKTTADATLRERNLAVAGVAMGAAVAARDPRAAIEPLTQAIDFYEAHGLTASLPEPLLLRARCASRMHDGASAMRDLDRGMSIVEKRATAAANVLDAEHALFTDAIAIALDRGDVAAAFTIAERSHGAALTIAELQQRLAGSDTAVLEIVALPRELVTFAIAANDSAVAHRPRASESLASLADESLSEMEITAEAALYEDVIRPVDSVIANAHELIIVADARLQGAPFAALYDKTQQRYLIERFAVSLASNAASLQRDASRNTAPSLAVIALPTGGAESKALPEVQQEVHDMASIYGHAQSIDAQGATLAALANAARTADVIHIAGHTEQQRGGGEQALLFAGARGDVERVSWKTIVTSRPVQRGVVVLAACETLRCPASSATHAPSLGEAFSAGGVSDVIGTLAPIGDRDARELFAALHHSLASGMRPADALRSAQLDAITREKTGGGRRAWRAVALLTRHTSAPLH